MPKVLTDKNGVTTTRWVKPEKTGPKLSALPQPTMSTQQLRASNLGSLYKAFSDNAGTLEIDDIEVDYLTSMVKPLEDATLSVLVDFVYCNNGEANYGRIIDMEEAVNSYIDGVTLRELLSYYGDTDEEGIHDVAERVLSLHRCTELPVMEDYSQADVETREKVIELLQSAVVVSSPIFPEGRRAVLGKEMQQMLEAHSDRDAVIEVMARRNTEDVALIRSILASETPAISDGIL